MPPKVNPHLSSKINLSFWPKEYFELSKHDKNNYDFTIEQRIEVIRIRGHIKPVDIAKALGIGVFVVHKILNSLPKDFVKKVRTTGFLKESDILKQPPTENLINQYINESTEPENLNNVQNLAQTESMEPENLENKLENKEQTKPQPLSDDAK